MLALSFAIVGSFMFALGLLVGWHLGRPASGVTQPKYQGGNLNLVPSAS